MNWFDLKLCLFALLYFTSYCVNAENDAKINLHNNEEELLPSEQIVNRNDEVTRGKKESVKLTDKQVKQTLQPYLGGRNLGHNFGFPIGHGIVPNYLGGQRLDAQASSSSNNVVLVLGDEKQKLGELVRPAEESIRRLTRNPDVLDDIVQHFNQFSGNVAQQMLQQVAQTGPEISRTFGQALNEVLAQTSLLAQTPPGNLNLTGLTPNLNQPAQPANFDFGQLGHSLSQSFMVGAAQNLLNPQDTQKNTTNSNADSTQDVEPQVGLAHQNNFGNSLLPPFNFGLPSFGTLSPLRLFNPLLPMASEVSEVRVRPDNYNPYKLTPKEVDHQTMAEMKLKVILRDALFRKTIPILWFHLPNDHNIQKSTEDLETETKLKIFEKEVVAELKQLQELSKLANEMKKAQLQIGTQPTASLTKKLVLSDIPIYDITLGDIETTLKDEHVIMLMQTIAKNQNWENQRRHQATTQYLIDLTGTPIKRQINAEDALKSMEKDDIMKIMTYAYRMAAIHGHELPWLKNEKFASLNTENTGEIIEKQGAEDNQRKIALEAEKQRKANYENLRDINQRNTVMIQWSDPNIPLMFSNTQMASEKQCLDANQRQMLIEAEKQMRLANSQQWADPNTPPKLQPSMGDREMTSEKQRQMAPEAAMRSRTSFTSQWADPNMQQQQRQPQVQIIQMTPENQWLKKKQRQKMMEAEQQKKLLDSQQNANIRQWVDPNMSSKMQPMMSNRQMVPEKQMKTTDFQQNVYMRQWIDPNMPAQKQPMVSVERTAEKQWLEDKAQTMAMEAEMQRKFTNNQQNMWLRQWADPNIPPQMPIQRQRMDLNMQQPQQQKQQQQEMEIKNMPNLNLQPPMILQRQWFDTSLLQTRQPFMMQPQIENPYSNPQSVQTQWAEWNIQQLQPVQRQSSDSNISQTTNVSDNAASSNLKNSDQQLESKPKETNAENITEEKIPNPTVGDLKATVKLEELGRRDDAQTECKDGEIILGEAQPQTVENSGNARFKGNLFGVFRPNAFNHFNVDTSIDPERPGSKKFFDEMNVLDNGKNRNIYSKPSVNYYYNNNWYVTSYPPTDGQSGAPILTVPPLTHTNYGPGYGKPPNTGPVPPFNQHPAYYNTNSKPTVRPYGGGGSGSNAYGSYGRYRAAHMLQQHQQAPKMMMPNDDDDPQPLFTINTTTHTDYGKGNANTTTTATTKTSSKRLARNGKRSVNSPAAYLIVVRNNNNENNNNKSPNIKSRSKRSTEYATLEAIDENSLNILRKTYKNSLKEITLKPNETPEEALMRYNAESIREALEKVSQQPMEINADTAVINDHRESARDGNKIEKHQQEQHAPMTYVLNDNGHFEAVQTFGSQSHSPSSVSMPIHQYHKQLPEVNYQNSQEEFYNSYVVKHNNPSFAYDVNPKILSQNSYSSIYNSLELVPHDYSVPNRAYQVSYPNNLNAIPKTSKSSIYRKSFLQPDLSGHRISNDPSIDLQPTISSSLGDVTMEYDELSKGPLYTNYPAQLSRTKEPYLFANSLNKHQSKVAKPMLSNHFKTSTNTEKSVSFENLMSVITERLTQCCNGCKNTILKTIEAILKGKQNNNDNATFLTQQQHYILTYPKPLSTEKDDVEYQQWLMEMSEKGYDKSYLTKEHHREYLKDGQFNLYITTEDTYGSPEDEKVFYRNNQSYKREAATESHMEKEKTKVAAPLTLSNNMKELIEDEKKDKKEKEEIKQEELKRELKEEHEKNLVNESNQKTLNANAVRIKASVSKTVNKEKIKGQEKKISTQKTSTQSVNSNDIKTMETAEATTHSVYAMRGQFRPQKLRPRPFVMGVHARHFDNYENINKIGNANTITKAENKNNNNSNNYPGKNNKLKEIFDLLHDISKQTKEQKSQNSKEKDDAKATTSTSQ